MERKSLEEHSVVFLVEGEKFKLPLPNAANSAGASLKFAAFISGPDAKLARLL